MLDKSAAVVAHAFWNRPGGGQLVCAAAAVSLHSIGYDTVVLAAVTRFDPSRYREWFGIDLSIFPLVSSSFSLNYFGIYQRMLTYRYALKAVKRFNANLLFIDEVFYKRLLRIRDQLAIAEYIHFPYEVVLDERLRSTGLYYGEDPYLLERYGRFPMNVYWRVYVWLSRYFMRDNPFSDADVVFTNSKWTARIVQQVYGGKPFVLNPPLPPNVIIRNEENVPRFNERREYVIMLGRFSEEKRYHWVIEEIAPRLVKAYRNAKIIIIGSTGNLPSKSYYEHVARLAQTKGLTVCKNRCGDNCQVCLLSNLSREKINSYMDSARVFLHATINEHWGIAVAEAMARGLPVVVHRSGGVWTDLVEEGFYGMGYENADDALNAILKLLTDENAWRIYSSRSIQKAKSLNLESFEEKLRMYLAKAGLL